jgi:hypothetical protein
MGRRKDQWIQFCPEELDELCCFLGNAKMQRYGATWRISDPLFRKIRAARSLAYLDAEKRLGLRTALQKQIEELEKNENPKDDQ